MTSNASKGKKRPTRDKQGHGHAGISQACKIIANTAKMYQHIPKTFPKSSQNISTKIFPKIIRNPSKKLPKSHQNPSKIIKNPSKIDPRASPKRPLRKVSKNIEKSDLWDYRFGSPFWSKSEKNGDQKTWKIMVRKRHAF